MSTSTAKRPSTASTMGTHEVKKKSSFRSLFSIFRRSSKADITSGYPQKNTESSAASSTTSTTFLPSEVRLPDAQLIKKDYEASASTISLPAEISPPFSRTPSTSSASTLSMENGSEASTAITTPSTSSPSVLMKAISPEAIGSTSTPEQPRGNSPPRDSVILCMKEKRNSTDMAGWSPSKITDANSPFPVHHTTTGKNEDLEQLKMKRRNSFKGMILRRSKSNPDLCSDDDELPTNRRSPSRPSSVASNASSSSGLARRLSRRTSSKGIHGLDPDAVPNPVRHREEHLLILGADPSGSSFYLYPTTKQEVLQRRKSNVSQAAARPIPRKRYTTSVDDYKRRSWGGVDGSRVDTSDGPPPRPRPVMRGALRPPSSFRGNVATQVIVEEGSDVGDSQKIMPPRRHSAVPGQYDDWHMRGPGHRPASSPVRSSIPVFLKHY